MAASLRFREPDPRDIAKFPTRKSPKQRSRKWRWIAGIFLVLALICAFGLWYAASHVSPILRARVIDTLSDRFKGKVELAGLEVSAFNGLAVHGTGLTIYGMNDPNPSAPGLQPLIKVEEFRFQTSFRAVFRSPMHVHTVFVKGLTLNIPPKEDIQDLSDIRKSSHRMTIVVDELNCEDTNLVINTRKPGKQPLVFAISHLKMEDIGAGQPMRFHATLVNPKPVGDIASVGYFGPFQETRPRATPVSGDYSFSNADLGNFRGIAGILSSVGDYRGTLGRIEVAGETDTPDFRLTRSGHPVPLHTDFHAIVDGTDGDTYLEPVNAKFLHTSFTASGKVVRVQPKGHDIELNVVMNQGRVEDLLRLGVKTDPPVLSGPIVMHAKMGLPPSDEDIADRLRLNGTFSITNAEFSNDKIQDRLDALSLRAQGHPNLAQEHVDVNVPSKFSGTFHLSNGLFQFLKMEFALPAVESQFTGQYSLDGNVFDFHGKLRLRAKLSQMTTGWKSILLKPVDPFFAKHGAGTELPFKITGTKSEPHFGLDFGHHDAEAEGKPNPTQ
ncbi:MAG TPA: hypothetical protein VMP68_04445 [Candidatus Eisenbacteria bacterium]|nr:hypothetical protein [Candidatus Eisenbacteria bacterium]